MIIIETVDPDGTPRSVILGDDTAEVEVSPEVEAEIKRIVEEVQAEAAQRKN